MVNGKRDTKYDLLRVLAMGLVITIHVLGSTFPVNVGKGVGIAHEIFISFLFVCNPIFFIVSGHFNLHYTGNSVKDYVNYIYKKIIGIVLPLFVYQIIFYMVSILGQIKNLSLWQIFHDFFVNILQDYTSSYFWFMYVLIGLLIAAPFFSKMIDKLTEDEQKLLIACGLIFQLIVMILQMFQIQWAVSNYPFVGWTLFFLMGRLLENVTLSKKHRWYSFLIALICLIFNVTISIVQPNNSLHLHDLSPTYIIFAVIIYLVLRDSSLIKKMSEHSVVNFLSQRSYGTYLCHGALLLVVEKFVNIGGFIPNFFTRLVILIISAIVFSLIIDKIVINPIQRILKRKLA